MAARHSDEMALNIVMALLVGVPVGIVVGLAVGGIGAVAGRDWGAVAGRVAAAVAVMAVVVALARFERSFRQVREDRDGDARETNPGSSFRSV